MSTTQHCTFTHTYYRHVKIDLESIGLTKVGYMMESVVYNHITDLYKNAVHSCIDQVRYSVYKYFAVTPTSKTKNIEIQNSKLLNQTSISDHFSI